MSSQNPDEIDVIINEVVEELCKTIKDLKLNFEVKIGYYLEKYMVDIHKIEVNGEPMNFSQAGILIQNSASCYSRKVDFLHQHSIRVLNELGKGKGGVEGEGGEGEGTTSKRRRGDTEQKDFVFLQTERGKNIDRKECPTNLKIQFIAVTPREFIEREGQDASINKVDLYYGQNHELLGSKQDFKMNSQFSMATCTFGERLYTVGPGESDLNQTLPNVNYQSGNGPGMGLDDEVLLPPPDRGGEEEIGQPIPPDLGTQENDYVYETLYDDLHAAGEDDIPEAEDEEMLETSKRAEGKKQSNRLRERILNLEHTPPKKLIEEDPWSQLCNPFDTEQEGPQKPVRRGNVFRLPPSITQKHKAAKSKRPIEKLSAPPISEFIHALDGAPVSSSHPYLADHIAVEKERIKELLKQRRKSRRPLSNREAPEPAVPEDWEDDEADGGYQEEGQHEVEDAAEDNQDFEPLPAFEFPDPHIGGQIGAALDIHAYTDRERNSSQGTSYEDLVTKMVADFVKRSQAWVASTELAQQVNAWHEMIAPRLEKVEKSSAFDIHKYGSDILDCFPSENRKTTLSFGEIVRGKTREDVARYFLSSLMLANSHNVEIVSRGKMDDLQLRFLTTVRHHEELDEFQAASQQDASASKRPRL